MNNSILNFLGEGYQDLKYIEIDHSSRLYYYNKDISFNFTAIEIVSYNTKKHNEAWNDKDTKFEYLAIGSGTFDGIRHLHFIDTDEEMKGYFYYPDFERLKKLMNKLIELEKMLSRKYDE